MRKRGHELIKAQRKQTHQTATISSGIFRSLGIENGFEKILRLCCTASGFTEKKKKTKKRRAKTKRNRGGRKRRRRRRRRRRR